MSASPTTPRTAILGILGVDEQSPAADLLSRKPSLAKEAQDYYESVFHPTDASAEGLPLVVRALVAARTASYTRSTRPVDWYLALAADAGATEAQLAASTDTTTEVGDDPILAAAIRHTDLLATSPSSATPDHIAALRQAGLSSAAIVALAQTIAFVTYQVRLIAGLRALGQSTPTTEA